MEPKWRLEAGFRVTDLIRAEKRGNCELFSEVKKGKRMKKERSGGRGCSPVDE